MIISLYAGGMTVRDIAHHLESTLGTELSQETISKITDEVLEEVLEWQNRPLDPLYPILYLDAIIIKVRDGHQVQNRAAHIAVGVDMEGIKHVLGIWVEATEGAKFWAGVCAELANRGVRDVLIVCCDGLTGFPEAIAATWPTATVQTCVVHLIRASMRFIGYQDRKKVAAALRPVYTAPTAEAAQDALDDFEASELGRKYPATVRTWRNGWEKFIPFLAFPPPVRRIIYTTNAIESLNYQLRKITKNRGHFPERPGRRETALARHLQHRRQTRQGTGQTRPQDPGEPLQDRRQTHRRHRHPGLERSPRNPRPELPRPTRTLPKPMTPHSTYTNNLTGPVHSVHTGVQVMPWLIGDPPIAYFC